MERLWKQEAAFVLLKLYAGATALHTRIHTRGYMEPKYSDSFNNKERKLFHTVRTSFYICN